MRLALTLALLAFPAGAECRLALGLAMDVSRSVSAQDFAIQTEGLALALEDSAIRTAFFLYDGSVALAAYQWSGTGEQTLLVDWTEVASDADLDRIAALIRAAPRPDEQRLTALGEALAFGKALLDRAPACRRRVLDMAGDGQNNEGISPARVYARGGWDGITVNALAIGEHEMLFLPYLREQVIRGPGAFVEMAPRQTDFPRAIRRKLLRELVEAVAALVPTGRKS